MVSTDARWASAPRFPGPDFRDLLPLPNQVRHHRHRLRIAPIDVLGEGGQQRTDDGGASLHLAQHRPEVWPGPEERGRVVRDPVQPFQRGSLRPGGVLQLGEPLVGPAAEGLGDKVLLAVEELVNRRRRITRKVADAAQRAVPQAVLAEDPFCGVEDFRHALRAARSAALTAHFRPRRVGHGPTLNHVSP